MSAPKPFPFPIGIGTDVCRVNRIAAILRREYTRNRWVRKVFTRLEWPALHKKFQDIEKAKGEPIEQANLANDQNLGDEGQPAANYYTKIGWMLPKLSGYSSIFRNEKSYWSAIADDRSALGGLARHLAGRWAAKEAAIKAHRHRQLYMRDISIVRPVIPSNLFPGASTAAARKLIALIEPPSDRIEITPRVATRRGLRGFGLQNHWLCKGPLMTRDELRKDVQDMEESEVDKGIHYYRKALIKASDRQVAEVNISHDGDYAVAMCLAFDPPDSTLSEKTIVDTGEGISLHEPQWGDEGWLDLAIPGLGGGSFGLKKDPPLDTPLSDWMGDPNASPDSDRFEKTFKELFDSSDIPPLP